MMYKDGKDSESFFPYIVWHLQNMRNFSGSLKRHKPHTIPETATHVVSTLMMMAAHNPLSIRDVIQTKGARLIFFSQGGRMATQMTRIPDVYTT